MKGLLGRSDAGTATRCVAEPDLNSPPALPGRLQVGLQVGLQTGLPGALPDRQSAIRRARRGAVAWSRGLQAEEAACAALVRDGWNILMRRARTGAGEIDIVAERRLEHEPSLLAFIEVKARPRLSNAAASLSRRQQARLLIAAEILLGSNPGWTQDGIRFDLLLVDAAGQVRRIADAFRREWTD